jgi:alpha-D-ribose 1-methylphosphonate 5-phosphate C-P lyase
MSNKRLTNPDDTVPIDFDDKKGWVIRKEKYCKNCIYNESYLDEPISILSLISH